MQNLEATLREVDRSIKEWFKVVDPYQYKSTLSQWGTRKTVPLCPICGAECRYDEDYIDHFKSEEHVTCPNYHYLYSYVTGNTETVIGSVTVYGSYSDSEEEKEHQNRIINLALIHERTEWRKKHG